MNKRMTTTQRTRRSAKPTGRYRKVEVRTWGDEKFRALSPMPPCGQGLWLYIITGPHTGPIPGLFRASRAAMAEDLGWSAEAFGEAFREAFLQGMVLADFDSRVMWVPNAIRHNKPESPNVVRSWAAEFDLIPECDLKRTAFEALKASIHALGEAYAKAFDESFTKPSPKPSLKPSPDPSRKPSPKAMANQEQEQEQEIYTEAKASAPAAPARPISLPKEAQEPAQPMTAKERVWTIGVGVFGEDQSARKRIGKLAGTYGDEVLAEVLAQAVIEKPADPMSWVTAACEARKLARPKPNGHEAQQLDMLADPTPQWALDAGFRNRFEAENEGCRPGNASQFREGRRVAP